MTLDEAFAAYAKGKRWSLPTRAAATAAFKAGWLAQYAALASEGVALSLKNCRECGCLHHRDLPCVQPPHASAAGTEQGTGREGGL